MIFLRCSLFFSFLICSTSVIGQRILLEVSNKTKNHITLKCEHQCSPGTIVQYDTQQGCIELIIFKQLDSLMYLSIKRESSVCKATIEDLQIGDVAETDAVHAFDVNRNFWKSLTNWYLKGNTEWLRIRNQSFIDSGYIEVNEPLLLDLISPPIEGYLCLFELRDSNNVIVYFPNQIGNDMKQVFSLKPSYNLTYTKTHDNNLKKTSSFINAGLWCDGHGQNTFILLVSTKPLSLNSFSKEASTLNYYLYDGKTKISPSKIGPGLFLKKDKNAITDINYLNGTNWAIAKISFLVKEE